jgi:hypothetical protein
MPVALINIRADPETFEYRYVSVTYSGTWSVYASSDIFEDFAAAVDEVKQLHAQGYLVGTSDLTEEFLAASGVYGLVLDDDGFPLLVQRVALAA